MGIMSLISTVVSGKYWVRYFVLETEPLFGDMSLYESDIDELDRLMRSFPGFVPESDEEVEVPPVVVDYLAELLNDPNAKPTKEVQSQIKGCPVNLPKLSQYLTAYYEADPDGDGATGGHIVNLYKAQYTVAPSLMELAALKTNELGLTTDEIEAIIGSGTSRRVKSLTNVKVGRHQRPQPRGT